MGCRGREAFRQDPIHADRPGDIFEILLTQIRKGEVEPPGRILLNPRRHANPARIGQGLQAGGDVDPIAKDVALLDDDVTLMDADAKLDLAIRRSVTVPAGNLALDLDRAAERIDNAGELDEEPVAGGLDQPAAMRGNCPVDHFGPDRLQPMEGPFLVGPDQA